MNRMDYFIELYGALPRGGPGDDASTRRAFEMAEHLPPEPRILDIGCGPGMQTLELLRLSRGTVVALDLLPQMVSRVTEAARAAGFEDRLEAVRADMNETAFDPASFDLVWSEGAVYFLGFEKGLARFKDLVPPGGYVAVSEAVWLEPGAPQEVLELWQGYPEIDTVEKKLEIVARLGFENAGHFLLPDSSWTDLYYDPLAVRVREYEEKWKAIPDAESVLAEARNEIAIFDAYSRHYGYAFFVMRK